MNVSGRIDVLLNNAGYGVVGAVEETGSDKVKKNFETGMTGYTGFGIYCATKFAVEGITESLALEVAPLGIYVTAVAPGFFRTNFLDGSSLLRADRVISDYVGISGEMENFAYVAFELINVL